MFDGDVLNIYYIINRPFFLRAYQVLNPRNSMYVSNNDGKLNSDLIPERDILILSNTMRRLGNDCYTQEDMDKINRIKQMNNIY